MNDINLSLDSVLSRASQYLDQPWQTSSIDHSQNLGEIGRTHFTGSGSAGFHPENIDEYRQDILSENQIQFFDEESLFPNLRTQYEPHGMATPGTLIPDDFVTSGSQWNQPDGKGTSVNITYSYSNLLDGTIGLTNYEITSAIEEALGLWAEYAPLNFVEVVDSGPTPSDSPYSASDHPDIRFGHHFIDGSGSYLAHAYFPSSDGLAGDVHFDNGDTWRIASSGSGFDLLEVAVHEIGHALGLDHEPEPDSEPDSGGNTAIMNPYYGGRYSGLGTSFLFQDDIDGIREIYGSGNGSVTPLIEDEYLVGDWDGDGRDNIAIRRDNEIVMDYNFDGVFDQIQSYGRGNSEDEYLVGDWNGDGRDNIAVRRGNKILMDYNFDSSHDRIQYYGRGNSEDEYLVGNWDGIGGDNIAVRRGNQILMDYNFDSSHDRIQYYGRGNSEDEYLVGNWDGMGGDNIAVRRGNKILMDYNFDGTYDRIQYYGRGNSEDEYLVGNWDGMGGDNIAVRRGNKILMDYNFDGTYDRIQSYGRNIF